MWDISEIYIHYNILIKHIFIMKNTEGMWIYYIHLFSWNPDNTWREIYCVIILFSAIFLSIVLKCNFAVKAIMMLKFITLLVKKWFFKAIHFIPRQKIFQRILNDVDGTFIRNNVWAIYCNIRSISYWSFVCKRYHHGHVR